MSDFDNLKAAKRNDIETLREELDYYYSEMRGFSEYELEEVYLRLSAWSARVNEIRTQIVRQESRAFLSFRTKEIEPFLSEIRNQFSIWSRVQSTRETDYKLAGKL